MRRARKWKRSEAVPQTGMIEHVFICVPNAGGFWRFLHSSGIKSVGEYIRTNSRAEFFPRSISNQKSIKQKESNIGAQARRLPACPLAPPTLETSQMTFPKLGDPALEPNDRPFGRKCWRMVEPFEALKRQEFEAAELVMRDSKNLPHGGPRAFQRESP